MTISQCQCLLSRLILADRKGVGIKIGTRESPTDRGGVGGPRQWTMTFKSIPHCHRGGSLTCDYLKQF